MNLHVALSHLQLDYWRLRCPALLPNTRDRRAKKRWQWPSTVKSRSQTCTVSQSKYMHILDCWFRKDMNTHLPLSAWKSSHDRGRPRARASPSWPPPWTGWKTGDDDRSRRPTTLLPEAKTGGWFGVVTVIINVTIIAQTFSILSRLMAQRGFVSMPTAGWGSVTCCTSRLGHSTRRSRRSGTNMAIRVRRKPKYDTVTGDYRSRTLEHASSSHSVHDIVRIN